MKRLKKQQHILKVPMTLKEKISWPNNIIYKQVGNTSPWIIHTTYQKPKKTQPPKKTHPSSKTPQHPHFSPSEKIDVFFLWAKSTWSQTSFNGFSFQMWIKHLPSAIGAGACCCPCRLLIWQSWGCLHGTRWWVEFLSGHRDTSGAKNASCQVGFLGWFYFCLR